MLRKDLVWVVGDLFCVPEFGRLFWEFLSTGLCLFLKSGLFWPYWNGKGLWPDETRNKFHKRRRGSLPTNANAIPFGFWGLLHLLPCRSKPKARSFTVSSRFAFKGWCYWVPWDAPRSFPLTPPDGVSRVKWLALFLGCWGPWIEFVSRLVAYWPPLFQVLNNPTDTRRMTVDVLCSNFNGPSLSGKSFR